MTEPETLRLIPSPPVVRERLASHYTEGRLLRRLYRLSVQAAQERRRTGPREHPAAPEADGSDAGGDR